MANRRQGEHAMIEDLERLSSTSSRQIEAAATLDELQQVEAELLGKRSDLTRLKSSLGSLEPDQRREAGAALNQTRASLAAAVDTRRRELNAEARRARLEAERLDLTEVI